MRSIREIMAEHEALELRLRGKPGERLEDLEDDETTDVEKSDETVLQNGEGKFAFTNEDDSKHDDADHENTQSVDATVEQESGYENNQQSGLAVDEPTAFDHPDFETDNQPESERQQEYSHEDPVVQSAESEQQELSDPEPQGQSPELSFDDSADFESSPVSENQPEAEQPDQSEYAQPEQSEVPSLDDFPDVDAGEVASVDQTSPAMQPAGFQGYVEEPSVPQAEMDRRDQLSGEEMTFEKYSEKQYEWGQKMSAHLAEELAREIGPAFDELREHQTNSVHAYVQEQTMLTALLRPRG